MHELRTVTPVRTRLGEGPLWHKGAIYWLDILDKKIYRYFPQENWLSEMALSQYVGTIVPRKKRGFVLAMQHGFYMLYGLNGKLTQVADPESQKPGNRFNDGKCDTKGRFWAGTMAQDESPGQGSLYMLDAYRQVHKKYSPISISNGICWSLDNTKMYYIDTPTRQISVFDFEPATGEIKNHRPLIAIQEKGSPDGMTIDRNGNLWVALWGGGAVVCYDSKTQKLLRKINLPVSKISSCTFGGQNLDELYITTAITPGEPLSGHLFRVNLGVRGLTANCFCG